MVKEDKRKNYMAKAIIAAVDHVIDRLVNENLNVNINIKLKREEDDEIG